MPDVVDNSAFSPKRAALHAAVAAAIAVALLAALAVATDVKDPRRFGEGVGMFVAFLAVLVFGVSWLAQTGRRRAAWAVGVGFAVLVTAAVVVTVAGAPSRWVTDADRAPLVLEGEGDAARLANRGLGFSIAPPGASFARSEQVARMFGQDPDRPTWGWLDQLNGAALVVTVEPGLGPGVPQRRVEEFVSGMVDGLRLEVAERDITWGGAAPGFRLEGEVAGQPVRITGRGARLGAEGHPAAVIVMSIGDAAGALDAVHTSLAVPE